MIIEGNGILSEKFFALQQIIKPDYAIEVGAHAADFALEMSKLFGVNAVAFEANPNVFQHHREYANTDLVKYLHYAISDYDGVIKFKVHDSHPLAGNNSIKKRHSTDTFQEHEVQCYTLDTFFKNTKFENACLWMDVEGANGEVLSGAVKTLERCSSIFIETEDVEFWENQWMTSDVEKFLEYHGFEKFDAESPYYGQQNIIFIRKGAINDHTSN